jgi:hypothetical protein
MREGSHLFSFMCGVGVTLFCIVCVIYLFGGFNNQSPSEVVNITIKDKEGSDQTVYTDTNHIYTTNKFQWKYLEINHTYQCEQYFTGIDNCTEIYP